jgi:hypothetical protein
MKLNNIPVLIQQLAENALDLKTPEHIRYNYMISLENIRAYCDKTLREYNDKSKAGR